MHDLPMLVAWATMHTTGASPMEVAAAEATTKSGHEPLKPRIGFGRGSTNNGPATFIIKRQKGTSNKKGLIVVDDPPQEQALANTTRYQ